MISRVALTVAIALMTGSVAARAENAISTEGLKASGNNVTVGSVTADKKGYVVVHMTDATGTMPGPVIGTTPVQPGHHADVAVALEKNIKPGTKLIVMLHEEGNGDNTFDAADKPATAGRGPVEQFVTVE